MAGSCGNSVELFEEPSSCLAQQRHRFIFPPAMYKRPVFSTASLTLIFLFKTILAVLME